MADIIMRTLFNGIDYNKTIFKWHPLKSKHFFMAEIKMRSFLNGIDYRERPDIFILLNLRRN